MNVRIDSIVALIALAFLTAGCDSSPAKSDAEARKSFIGGPMPKGFMTNMNAAQSAAQKAAQAAASKAGQNAGN